MTSCIALVPKRNECFLGVRHRFKAKEKLWLNETWLPLRNPQSREGERYVSRHNEVRQAARPLGNREQGAPPPGTSCLPHREALMARRRLTQQELAEEGKLDPRK